MKKIAEIKAGRNIDLTSLGLIAEKISKIWTIYDEDEMWNYCKFNPITGVEVVKGDLNTLQPFHLHGVFLEDYVHDWNIDKKNNLLHFYSRVVRQGETINILVEYKED